MTWNDIILDHPQLSPTDKLVFHLLIHLGGDSPRTRRQLRRWLGLSDRHLRRIRDQLHAFGFRLPAPSAPLQNAQVPAPEGEDAQVQTGRTCPVEADIQVQTGRTCPLPDVHVRSANAPTRTLWSSSSEEDVLVKASTPPPPSLGGAGGEEVPAEFLVEMESIWRAIAPQEREAPREWFRTLHREFGPQIPLLVFQQFAQSQRTLAHLRHPPSYKSYFTRCCHRAREEGTAMPRQGRAAPAPSHALTAADYHLSDFYTPDPAQT